jgi:diadenylate cyclase
MATELFRVGFLNFTLLDLADVSVVTFLFYKLYKFMQGTVAAQIFTGLIAILIASAAANFLNLTSLDWLLNKLTSIWFIVIVVLFQPELRRLLLYLGQNRVFGGIFRTDSNLVIDMVVDAVGELSDRHYGALIVFVRNVGITPYIETGEKVGAEVSKRLLVSLFFPNSPLHDGAVIIQNKTIAAARCILPLTQNQNLSPVFGMRHRAALGISEQGDALVVVVSEETGKISLAENGTLLTGLSLPELRKKLIEGLSSFKAQAAALVRA